MLTARGEAQGVPAPILGDFRALDQAGVDEARKELRDGRSGYRRAAGQLGSGEVFGRNRAKRQELSDG